MESLLVLRGVREVSTVAKPSVPETVSQRAYAEWEEQRRARGLPEPRVVERRGGRRDRKPRDYSRNVGAARTGEELHKRRWADADTCTAWIARYLAELGPGQRSTVRGYDDWARTQPGAPRASKFGQHGGWESSDARRSRTLASSRCRARQRVYARRHEMARLPRAPTRRVQAGTRRARQPGTTRTSRRGRDTA